MRRCSQCGQTYPDDYLYCLSDGLPLAADSGGFQSSGETPTQYIVRPPNTNYQIPQAVVPKWVFPLVGILCGLLIVFGFFAFFRESSSEKSDISQKNTESGKSNKNIETQRSPQVEATPFPSRPLPPSPTPIIKPGNYSAVTVNSPRDGYLALKSEPCVAPCGTMLIKIPHGTKLSLGMCKDTLEVADRRQGRWCSTSYDGYTGWIFDAFVTRDFGAR